MGKDVSYENEERGGRLYGGEIEDEGDEGSRLPLLLVIGLLVVAAFGGVVYLAYTQGVQRGREDAPRMLVAASGPVKQAPANAGGTDTPFKGLKIYQQPAPADDTDSEATPQSPTPKDASHAVQQSTSQMAAAPTAVAPKAPPPASAKDDQSGNSENLSVSADVATKPPAALQAPKKPKPAPAPKLAAVTPAAPPAETPSASPPAAAPAATGGSAALQIGAYKSEDEANAAFKAFSQKHSMVSAYASEVKKVDLGDKGVWYRLRLAGFADKSAASTFCDKLKADGGNCFLTR